MQLMMWWWENSDLLVATVLAHDTGSYIPYTSTTVPTHPDDRAPVLGHGDQLHPFCTYPPTLPVPIITISND